jgi:hypothetical protein
MTKAIGEVAPEAIGIATSIVALIAQIQGLG